MHTTLGLFLTFRPSSWWGHGRVGFNIGDLIAWRQSELVRFGTIYIYIYILFPQQVLFNWDNERVWIFDHEGYVACTNSGMSFFLVVWTALGMPTHEKGITFLMQYMNVFVFEYVNYVLQF